MSAILIPGATASRCMTRSASPRRSRSASVEYADETIGATGRSTAGKRACSASGTETAQTVASPTATTQQARRIQCTVRPLASRVPSGVRRSTPLLSSPRGEQHRDDRHAVDDLAFQHHLQHCVEWERADVDELRFIGRAIAALKAVGQKQMRRLVHDALARVVRAHLLQALCLISGLFRQLALSCLLQRLTRVDTASGPFAGRTTSHIAILPYAPGRIT